MELRLLTTEVTETWNLSYCSTWKGIA